MRGGWVLVSSGGRSGSGVWCFEVLVKVRFWDFRFRDDSFKAIFWKLIIIIDQ